MQGSFFVFPRTGSFPSVPSFPHFPSFLFQPSMIRLEGSQRGRNTSSEFHSTMIRSAHSTSETKIAGVPNFAPHWFKSVSVTPRAREHAPQEKMGMCFATTFASVSLSGGQPTGMIEFTMDFRNREVASARRKI